MAETTHSKTHLEENLNVSISPALLISTATVLWTFSRILRARNQSWEDQWLSTPWRLLQTSQVILIQLQDIMGLWHAALSHAILSQWDSDPSPSLTPSRPTVTLTPVMERTWPTHQTSPHPLTPPTRMATLTAMDPTNSLMPKTTTTPSRLFQADEELTPVDQCEFIWVLRRNSEASSVN